MYWRLIINIISTYASPFFAFLVCVFCPQKEQGKNLRYAFFIALLLVAIDICNQVIRALSSNALPDIAIRILYFMGSMLILRIIRPNFSPQRKFLSFHQRLKMFIHLSTWGLILHPAIILYLLSITVLALGGFVFFPSDFLKVGQAGLGGHILHYSSYLFLVGLLLGILNVLITGKCEINILSFLAIGCGTIILFSIGQALILLTFFALSPYELIELKSYLLELGFGANYIFKKYWQDRTGLTTLKPLLLFAFTLATFIYFARFSIIPYLKRFSILASCSYFLLISSAFSDHLYLSNILFEKTMTPLSKGNKADLLKAQELIDHLNWQPFGIAICNMFLKYQLATSFLTLGNNERAKSIFSEIAALQLNRPYYLQTQSKLFLKTLKSTQKAKVLSFRFRELTHVEYMKENWKPALRLFLYLIGPQESEDHFKKNLQKMSTNTSEIKLPGLYDLINLKMYSAVLGYNTYFAIADKTLLKKLFQENIPFIVWIERQSYNFDYLANDAFYWYGSNFLLPICMDENQTWIGTYDSGLRADFTRHKSQKKLKMIITGQKSQQSTIREISNTSRENIIIIPMSTFLKFFRNSGSLIAILDHPSTNLSPLLYQLIPDIEKQTTWIAYLSQGSYYFYNKQYIQALESFLKAKSIHGSENNLLESFIALTGLILEQNLKQRSNATLLHITKAELDSFLQRYRHMIKPSYRLFEQYKKNLTLKPYILSYYLNRVVNTSWNTDLISLNLWLKKYARSYKNIILHTKLIKFFITINDYDGLVEFIPELLSISPHLSAYRLIYAHALLESNQIQKAKEEFDHLKWLIFYMSDSDDFVKDYVESLLKDNGTDDFISVRWKQSSAKWNYMAGYFALQEHQIQKATRYLKKAVQLDGSNSKYMSLYADVLEQSTNEEDQQYALILKNRSKLLSPD